jgi:hypothetical protein
MTKSTSDHDQLTGGGFRHLTLNSRTGSLESPQWATEHIGFPVFRLIEEADRRARYPVMWPLSEGESNEEPKRADVTELHRILEAGANGVHRFQGADYEGRRRQYLATKALQTLDQMIGRLQETGRWCNDSAHMLASAAGLLIDATVAGGEPVRLAFNQNARKRSEGGKKRHELDEKMAAFTQEQNAALPTTRKRTKKMAATAIEGKVREYGMAIGYPSDRLTWQSVYRWLPVKRRKLSPAS